VAAARDPSLDLESVRELFEASTDFTIGLEEEFAIVDPESLELEQRFEELYEACQADDLLAESAAGELIASEIEIRSGRSASFGEATERQREHRARLFALAEALGAGLAATGTHPWANYLDQRIIDTPHYQRLRRDL
jgi:glutamate---cysteine ligase / carboxylate-amine ligase